MLLGRCASSRAMRLGWVTAVVTTACASAQTPIQRLYGLDFSPYLDGQSPDSGTPISETQLRQRMGIIAPYTDWVRTYGLDSGIEKAGLVAHDLGRKIAMGAWLGRDTSPSGANEQQIATLIALANAGQVDLAIVGSETLERGDLTEAQLIGYLNRVRQAIPPAIPVTTADTFNALLTRANVIAAVDVVMVNDYPFFAQQPVGQAVTVLSGWHQQMKNAAGAKRVIISETGWPSGGTAVGAAVPSPQNAAAYFAAFVGWARSNQVDYFYFEAFDEAWKVVHEGEIGGHWGLWNSAGSLKPGMQGVFDGLIATCDVNGDGAVNALDVQLAVNSVMGLSACGVGDVDRNGRCDVVDVQRIVNAALGASCRIGP